MLDELDHGLLLYLNQFARQSLLFDNLATTILDRPSVKFVPIIGGLIWLWFREEAQLESRIAVGRAVLGSIVTLAVTKLIQSAIPPNPRPVHDPAVEFVEPYGAVGSILVDPTSFPSDTAALAFALATGVLMGSRPLGVLALLWAGIVVSLPRIYFGYHYPSDIIAGALIGVGSVLVLRPSRIWERAMGSVSGLVAKQPGLFYIAAFFVFFQIITSFADLRRIGSSAAQLASALG